MRKVTTVHYEPPVRVLDGWNMEIKGIETKIEVEEGDMKKEDVLKALECCGKNEREGTNIYCDVCPATSRDFRGKFHGCLDAITSYAIEIINNQEKEISKIIKCKGCKYNHCGECWHNNNMSYGSNSDGDEYNICFEVSDEHFCGYAERKDK